MVPTRAVLWRKQWFVGLLAVCAVLLLHATTDLISGLERRFYELGVAAKARASSPEVLVVAIDDASVAQLGPWPWPRALQAALIDKLAAAGAKTIVLATPWPEPQARRASVPAGGQAPLAAGLATVPAHAVLGGAVPAGRLAGKLVFVGPAAAVEHLARASAELSSGLAAVQPAWAQALQAILVLMVAAYLLFALPRLSRAVGALFTLALALALLAGGWTLLTRAGLWVQVVLPVVTLLVGYLASALRRAPVLALADTGAAETAAAAQRSNEPAPSAPPTAPSPATPEPARQMLGRYEIEKELGRGAMGAVYLGRDTKIGRVVALKTMALTREFEGAALNDARQRFFREAETAGRLQHPDIVTIFEAGEDHGLAYIAMECLKGLDLGAYTNPARLLPVPVALRIVARVADALAYAHSQGVTHRDIKPSNIMVDLGAGSVKVMDFGIARITDSTRTRTGVVLGTPSYMSPEQMSGRRVDGRSDLYSLGVALFQLLTGRLPFRGDSMAALMYSINNDTAPDLRSLKPELPEALANIVALALEKRPEVRYGDGRQLAADLRAVAVQIEAAPRPLPEGAQGGASGEPVQNGPR